MNDREASPDILGAYTTARDDVCGTGGTDALITIVHLFSVIL